MIIFQQTLLVVQFLHVKLRLSYKLKPMYQKQKTDFYIISQKYQNLIEKYEMKYFDNAGFSKKEGK